MIEHPPSEETTHNDATADPRTHSAAHENRHYERFGHDLGSHHGPMPQRARMFLDGLVRQPGDAISILATTVRRLVLRGATASERGAMILSRCGDLAEPSPLQAYTLLASVCFAFRRDRVGAPERHIGDAVRHGLCERLTSG